MPNVYIHHIIRLKKDDSKLKCAFGQRFWKEMKCKVIKAAAKDVKCVCNGQLSACLHQTQ